MSGSVEAQLLSKRRRAGNKCRNKAGTSNFSNESQDVK